MAKPENGMTGKSSGKPDRGATAAQGKNGKDPGTAGAVGGADASGATPTVSHMLGEMVWLLTQSPTHRHFALADLEWMIMPPLMLEQYRIFRGDTTPVGLALWAWLSEDAEKRLEAGLGRLRPDDWKSGDRLWLVDLVAPGANEENQLTQKILGDLLKTLGPQLGRARDGKLCFHRTDPETGERMVIRLGG